KIEAQRLLIFRLINIKKIDKAEEELESLIADQGNNIFNLILKSKIANYKGESDKKIQYLEEAYNLLQRNNVHVRDMKHLADELYYSKMYEMSESLLEKVTNNNLNHHPEIFQLLHAYFENGKNKKAISLAKNLLKEFPHRTEPVNILFLIYESLGNREKAIQCYEKFISVNSENDLIKIDLVFAYVRNEQLSKAKELLNTQFNLNKLSSDWINKLAIAYSQVGNLKKALEIQYQNIKNNPNNLELQNVYIGLVSFRKRQDNEWLVPPNKVSLDCYVKIKETITHQEMEIPAIEKDADIYTPDHELSRKLLGKKVGDIIQSGVAQYQIMEIKNKYIQKFQEIIKEANLKFPSNTFMRTISVPTDTSSESLSSILKKFMSDPPQRKKQLNELFKYYRRGEINIGFMSRIIGKHPVEVMEGLIQSSEHKFISSITGGENENCQKDLENKSDIVIDLSALIVLHWIQLEKYMEKGGFNLYVCQPTIDSLKELIRKRESHSKDGLLTVFTDENNGLVKDYMSPEKVTENLNFLMKIKKWSEEHCKIKSISDSFIMSRRKKMQWEKIIGKEFLDPLLTAHNEDNTILLCEDGLSGMVSKNVFQISRVRLFDMIEYFEKQVIIDNNEAIRFKSELVKLNQSYISIDHKILLYSLKESEYEISDTRFQRGLYFLGPISLLQGIIRVIADFLVALSQESSLLPYNEKVITKEVLNKASFGRHPDYVSKQLIQLVKLKTHLLPINQSRICNNIKEWRNEKAHYLVLP
ncbi:MAG: hypothetical protein OXB86_03710, partial [Bdellovibrionales bacterium]|nr:hypothetical protein [Bdellovibrionales bacterium]